MAFEIERRFLLKNDNWKDYITRRVLIEQAYLTEDFNNWITRIRFDGENYKITLKKHIKDSNSYEFEYSIPISDGEKIMSTLTNRIKKERFFLKINQDNWIIDCFKGKNYPLEIAEIELKQEKEKVLLPKFLSKEITGCKIFTNLSLATYPFSKWINKDLKNFREG